MTSIQTYAPASDKDVERVWRTRWGLPLVTVDSQYGPADVEALGYWADDQLRALVTWVRKDGVAELITVDALVPGHGYGSRLLAEVQRRLAEEGVERLTLVTTNDNLLGLRFYLEHGWRLVRVHLDALDRVREIKPSIPETGHDGMPIRDLWEIELSLA